MEIVNLSAHIKYRQVHAVPPVMPPAAVSNEVRPITHERRERAVMDQFRRWFMGSNETAESKAAFLRQYHEFVGGV